jgi:hypothetical protein
MRNFNMRFALYNAAAGVIGIVALLFVVRSMLPSPIAPCSGRYQTTMSLALERGGELLSVADLQGSLAGKDLGLAQHVALTRVPDAPAPVAMVVNLPKSGAPGPGKAQPEGAVTFPWEPRALQNTAAACLSYHLLLPASFEAGAGGVLPGILLADRSERSDAGSATRLAWRSSGAGGADQVGVGAHDKRIVALEREGFPLARGHWMKVDQEVVLNTLGRHDGALRVWLEGALVLERADLEYRSSADVTISGVAARLFYGNEENVARPPRETTVMFSPFEIRWQP